PARPRRRAPRPSPSPRAGDHRPASVPCPRRQRPSFPPPSSRGLSADPVATPWHHATTGSTVRKGANVRLTTGSRRRYPEDRDEIIPAARAPSGEKSRAERPAETGRSARGGPVAQALVEEVEHLVGGDGDDGAGREDRSRAGLAEGVEVLRRDHAAHHDHDV